jgi:hypothetical protein
MTQETALDWFIEKIGYQKDGEWYIGIREDINIQHWVDQVRQMEKEQIEDAYIMGSYDMASKEFKPEQYYNETYENRNTP